ncbi:MAG: hypothetical protein ACYCYN_09060 [Solirubrobacteraceae bacterium]
MGDTTGRRFQRHRALRGLRPALRAVVVALGGALVLCGVAADGVFGAGAGSAHSGSPPSSSSHGALPPGVTVVRELPALRTP